MKGPYAVLLQSTNDPHEFLVGYDGLQSLDEARAKRDDPELPDCEKVVVRVPDEDAEQWRLEEIPDPTFTTSGKEPIDIEPVASPWVGRDGNEALYEHERAVHDAIEKATYALGEALDVDRSEYWTRLLPLELESTLESYERGCAEAAAWAFLRSRGYTVFKLDNGGD